MSELKSTSAQPPGFSAWPHRLAIALVCATFPLVWIGGLVTTYDAGMAVPDWPTTYGYNLLLYPWQTWIAGPFDLFIEHGHRLLGAGVGVLAIALVAAVFFGDKRPSVRWGSVILLGLVILQGLLGGMRVRMDQRSLAMAHACLGLATFAFTAAMAVVTSRDWRYGSTGAPVDSLTRGKAGRFATLATITALLIYLQVVLGAFVRHMPVGATANVFRMAVLFHIVMAIVVLLHVAAMATRTFVDFRSVRRIEFPVGILGMLMLVQFGLGGGTWVLKYGWPSWLADLSFAAGYTIQASSFAQAMVTTLHVAVGAWILAVSCVIALRAWSCTMPGAGVSSPSFRRGKARWNGQASEAEAPRELAARLSGRAQDAPVRQRAGRYQRFDAGRGDRSWGGQLRAICHGILSARACSWRLTARCR